jgi:hypothetical protein
MPKRQFAAVECHFEQLHSTKSEIPGVASNGISNIDSRGAIHSHWNINRHRNLRTELIDH